MKNNKNIPKNNPFKVPENYFNEFNNKLSERIKEDNERTSYKRTFDIFKPYIYMAAGVLALTLFMKIGLNFFVDEPAPINSTEMQAQNNEDVFYDILIDDDYLFYNYIASIEYEDIMSEISNDDIESYLILDDYIDIELYMELEN